MTITTIASPTRYSKKGDTLDSREGKKKLKLKKQSKLKHDKENKSPGKNLNDSLKSDELNFIDDD